MVKVAIIGCGRWGQNLIRVFNDLPDARVVVCCNKENRDRLSDIRSQYPDMSTTQNLSELWTDSRLEAVVVATPDQTHFEIARHALASGKHVFVEKPLALSFTEALELMHLAEAQGKIVMAGHILLYHPAIRWIKERIDVGLISPASVLSTRVEFGVGREDADLLWSSVVHDIAVIQFLLGAEPAEIHAVGASLAIGGPRDTVFINLLFPGGVAGHVHAGFAGPHRERQFVVHATNEIVVFDGLNGTLDVFSRRDSRANLQPNNREYSKQFDAGVRVEMVRTKDALTVECEHFLNCVRGNTVPLSGGGNALAVMRTLDRIERILKDSAMTRERHSTTRASL